jgi:hypothetical protein
MSHSRMMFKQAQHAYDIYYIHHNTLLYATRLATLPSRSLDLTITMSSPSFSFTKYYRVLTRRGDLEEKTKTKR